MTFKHYMALKKAREVLEEKKKKAKNKRSSKYPGWGYTGYGYLGIHDSVTDAGGSGDGGGE